MNLNPPTLYFGARCWSQGQTLAQVRHRTAQMIESGLGPGSVVSFNADGSPETVWSFFAVLALKGVALPRPSTKTDGTDRAYLEAASCPPASLARLRLLTSGSTGSPKIVDLTETQLVASAEASRARIGCGPEDNWLCCLPLHHIAGLSTLLRAGMAGAAVTLHEHFEPERVNRAIDSGGITMVSLVPTMLGRLLDHREDIPFHPNLRVILLGGAPSSPELLERCRAIDAPVALTWGMTETASQVATRSPGDLRDDPDVGLPLPGVSVFVEDGRLGVAGAVAPGGRYLTSDYGHLDDEGRVVVTGRGDALIISGGENVDPRRVERVLLRHPCVRDAAVLGVQDTVWGERVCAFLAGDPSDLLAAWLAEHLEPHERPRQILWLEAIPRNAMGKLNARELRQRLASP